MLAWSLTLLETMPGGPDRVLVGSSIDRVVTYYFFLSFRKVLLEWYCNLQLREYRRIFRPSEEAGQLDNLSRRFAWFRRLLKIYEDEQSRIFPASWKIPACLCGAFSASTKYVIFI